jgi:hypothetical protein
MGRTVFELVVLWEVDEVALGHPLEVLDLPLQSAIHHF